MVGFLNESSELLQRNITLLDNVLDALDYQQHSLGVMYIISTKINEIQVNIFGLKKLVNLTTFSLLRTKIRIECFNK